jgi:hypothetical protein
MATAALGQSCDESEKPHASAQPWPEPPTESTFASRPRWTSRIRAAARGESETTDCWFDEPDLADRRSWAMPTGHGTYQGLDLELLDPNDENELTFLIEAQHSDLEDALQRGEEVIVDGEPMNRRLHITMHQVVANQFLADDPPVTWQTVQRLVGLGSVRL